MVTRHSPFLLKLERAAAATTIGLLLFFVSYAAELVLLRMGVQGARTIVDNVLIGSVGAAAAYLWVRYEAERHARVREKMILLVELNHHIREALTMIGESNLVPDREKRLRLIDEAVERVDRVLVELVPTVGEAASPRLTLAERKI
jgi:hypothetical protein